MAKSKNHTNHNQNRKAHRNPIRKPKVKIHASMKGVCPKFVKNLKYARKNNLPLSEQLRKFSIKKKQQQARDAGMQRRKEKKEAIKAKKAAETATKAAPKVTYVFKQGVRKATGLKPRKHKIIKKKEALKAAGKVAAKAAAKSTPKATEAAPKAAPVKK